MSSQRKTKVLQFLLWEEAAHRVGIARCAREKGWVLAWANDQSRDRLDDPTLSGIICQLHPGEPELIETIRNLNIPVVQLNDYVPELDAPSVVPDYAEAGRLAADHFVDRGFRHFIYVGRVLDKQSDNTMLAGYDRRIREAGLLTHTVFWDAPCPTTRKRQREVTHQEPHYLLDDRSKELRSRFGAELQSHTFPVAVFCPWMEYAVDIIDACNDGQFLIPEQVAILTVTDFPFQAELTEVPLSSIEMNYERQGLEAAELLHRLMRENSVPVDSIRIPPKQLTVRGSSDTFAVEHLHTARAVRYIMENIHRKDLSVDDVVLCSGMSRRNLYYRFKQHVGHSIAAEIKRVRLSNAEELLLNTAMTIADVARTCGFTSSHHLRRVLERDTGQTPSQFRKQHRTRKKSGSAKGKRSFQSLRAPQS